MVRLIHGRNFAVSIFQYFLMGGSDSPLKNFLHWRLSFWKPTGEKGPQLCT